MSTECESKSNSALRRFSAASLIAFLVCALGLAGSPQLHERAHHHSANAGHQCAVTLLEAGKCVQSDAPPLVIRPRAAVQLAKLPTLNPVWVPAPFLGASVFEHGPPALS